MIFAFLALILAVLLLFPLSATGSGAIYLPLLFLAASLFFSPRKVGLKEALKYLGLLPKVRELPRLLWQGVVALVCSVVLSVFLAFVFEFFGILDNSVIEEKILSLPIVVLVSTFTLVPLGEEAFFRGLLFRKISEKAKLSKSFLARHPWASGAVLSSALFAVLHFSYGSVSEILAAFSIALLFCFFTHKSNSLVPAVFAHASFNLLSIIYVLVYP